MIWLSSTDFRWSLYIYIYISHQFPVIYLWLSLYLPFLHPFSVASVASVAVPSPPSPIQGRRRDRRRSPRSWRRGRPCRQESEGDLPHADGQNTTWGRKKWGRIFGKEWWFRNSIITWWGWLGMSYVVGTESRNRFYTTSGLWYEGYVADVFCSGMLAT